MQNIESIIDKYVKKVSGKFGIGFVNLKTNEEYYQNKDDFFPAASTFKIPVIIEIFNQIKNGVLDLNCRYEYEEKMRSVGSGVLSTLSSGCELTLKDYITLMMIVSDNTATDMLVNLAGKENIKNMIDTMGLNKTKVDYTCNELIYAWLGVDDKTPLEKVDESLLNQQELKNHPMFTDENVKNDSTSPKDMVKMLSLIYNHQILDEKCCNDIMDIMKKCQTNSRIPRYLPDNIEIAHKTGTIDKVINDAGIIYTDKADYILVMYYNGNTATQDEYDANIKGYIGDQLLADLSREIYSYVVK